MVMHARAQPHAPWSRTLRLRETLSNYLPLLLMLALALATWWLVKNAPQPLKAITAKPLRHEADYLMFGATLQRFDREGRLRVEVQGEQMRHFPDTDTLEVQRVKILSYAPNGQVTVATAARAVANGDASEVRLEGAAQVQRAAQGGQAAVLFQGEFLHAFLDEGRVKSHRPVTLTMGDSQVQAAGFEYDDNTEVARLQGPLRTEWSPSRARGTKR